MKLILNKKLITCLLFFMAILIIAIGFYIYQSQTFKRALAIQKCPENYTENDTGMAEYKNTMVNWTTEFLKTHPEATVSDWAKAKSQLWIDNNCVVAIQRSKMSGKVADLKPYELVDYDIQNAISSAIETPFYTSELGFSFHYPKDMSVVNGSDGSDDNYRILVFPNTPKNENQLSTAIVISVSQNDPPITPLEWLKSPYSGADMSKGYSTLDIDGQKAISMENGDWVVVDTPSKGYQISIATLPGENPNQPLKDEMAEIVKSLTFR